MSRGSAEEQAPQVSNPRLTESQIVYAWRSWGSFSRKPSSYKVAYMATFLALAIATHLVVFLVGQRPPLLTIESPVEGERVFGDLRVRGTAGVGTAPLTSLTVNGRAVVADEPGFRRWHVDLPASALPAWQPGEAGGQTVQLEARVWDQDGLSTRVVRSFRLERAHQIALKEEPEPEPEKEEPEEKEPEKEPEQKEEPEEKPEPPPEPEPEPEQPKPEEKPEPKPEQPPEPKQPPKAPEPTTQPPPPPEPEKKPEPTPEPEPEVKPEPKPPPPPPPTEPEPPPPEPTPQPTPPPPLPATAEPPPAPDEPAPATAEPPPPPVARVSPRPEPEPEIKPPPPQPVAKLPPKPFTETKQQRDERVEKNLEQLNDWVLFRRSKVDLDDRRIPRIQLSNSRSREWMAIIAHFDLFPFAYRRSAPADGYFAIDFARRDVSKSKDFRYLTGRYDAQMMQILPNEIPMFRAPVRKLLRTYRIPGNDLVVAFASPRTLMRYMKWKAYETCRRMGVRPEDAAVCLGRLVRRNRTWVMQVRQIRLRSGAVIPVGDTG